MKACNRTHGQISAHTASPARTALRLDKWLWAARFFKTRGLATTAVAGGKIHLNGQRIKPSHTVKAGDRLRIQRGSFEYIVDVRGLTAQRRPAKEACLLYEETEASRLRREEVAVRIKMDKLAPGGHSVGKPDKRQRRHIVQFRRARERQSDDE